MEWAAIGCFTWLALILAVGAGAFLDVKWGAAAVVPYGIAVFCLAGALTWRRRRHNGAR